MYFNDYYNAFVSSTTLQLITATMAVLLFYIMRGTKIPYLHVMVFGVLLVILAAIAVNYPVDTVFCVDRNTITGHCYTEAGPGLVVLFAQSYLVAMLIYIPYKLAYKEYD